MFYLIFFIFGLCVGSFLNVVINRLETGESFVRGRSRCPKCQTTLAWFDLIPLASFFFLRGKCRRCDQKISWQYPLVELTAGLLFVYLAYYFSNLDLFYYLVIVSFLIVIFVYDLKHYLIPDSVVYPAILISLAFVLIKSPSFWPIVYSLFGAAFFGLIVLISREKWMGAGDIKLAILMGLILGWPNILVALMLAFISGAIVGIFLIISKKKRIKSEVPFAPFLCLTTLITLIYGSQIINWYSHILF